MPAWLEQFILQQIAKFVTADVIKELEAKIAAFFCCKLKGLVDSMSAGVEKDALENAVTLVASTLGVDLTKCPA